MAARSLNTIYNGQVFRSRTEARFALVFDLLKIKWHFEAESWLLPSGPYLPDFYLPHLRYWVEVKPNADSVALKKCDELAIHSERSVLLMCMEDLTPPAERVKYPGAWLSLPSGEMDTEYWLCQCPRCDAASIEWHGAISRSRICDCFAPTAKIYTSNATAINNAYKVARTFNFETDELLPSGNVVRVREFRSR